MKRTLIFIVLLLLIAMAVAGIFWHGVWWALLIMAPLGLLLVYDLYQRQHTLLRNYPIFGHIRYMLEDFRHQIRQYFIESDREHVPFSRVQRSIVYQRAKGVDDSRPFGKLQDVYAPGYEWFEHSIAALEPQTKEQRVSVGGEQCSQPYSASRLNISAMSYGALSGRAVASLNLGAKLGGFAQDTGEGGISRFHLEHGGDLIWEVGTGYFGCRDEQGRFNADDFAASACRPEVKMTELKLSQGAKPGGGGLLPGGKVTLDIARARGIPVGEDCHSPPAHSAFSTPRELLEFLAKMRELSGGKPVGFKLCIGRQEEFLGVIKAMLETGILPDFITVDGAEGGTGAAPPELTLNMGHSMRYGLVFVHNALVGAGLRDKLRVICAGKIITGFDMAAMIALGSDLCNSARGMMFSIGCIQARACNTNRCPTGVTTHDRWREHGLVVSDKGPRVANFHKSTISHFHLVLAACGMTDPAQLKPEMLWRRMTDLSMRNYRDLGEYLEPNELLTGISRPNWKEWWQRADAASFR